jgi:hypothetical protein
MSHQKELDEMETDYKLQIDQKNTELDQKFIKMQELRLAITQMEGNQRNEIEKTKFILNETQEKRESLLQFQI